MRCRSWGEGGQKREKVWPEALEQGTNRGPNGDDEGIGRRTSLQAGVKTFYGFKKSILKRERVGKSILKRRGSAVGRLEYLAPGAEPLVLSFPGMLLIQASGAEPIETIKALCEEVADGLDGGRIHAVWRVVRSSSSRGDGEH